MASPWPLGSLREGVVSSDKRSFGSGIPELSLPCECLSPGAEVAWILCALNAEHKAQGRQVDRQISARLDISGWKWQEPWGPRKEQQP